MRTRTLLIAAFVFTGSMVTADRIALSIARFTDGESVQENAFTTSTLPTPTGLAGTVVCVVSLSRSNDLVWNTAVGATEYRIDRAVGTGSFTTLATTTATSYVDTAVSSGTYHYRVAAKRYQWTSPASAAITLQQPTLCL